MPRPHLTVVPDSPDGATYDDLAHERANCIAALQLGSRIAAGATLWNPLTRDSIDAETATVREISDFLVTLKAQPASVVDLRLYQHDDEKILTARVLGVARDYLVAFVAASEHSEGWACTCEAFAFSLFGPDAPDGPCPHIAVVSTMARADDPSAGFRVVPEEITGLMHTHAALFGW